MKITSILYVTTQIPGTWRYFSWAAYPSMWYSRLQNKVINKFIKNSKINFKIKFYPNDCFINPNIEYVKQFNKDIIIENSLIETLKQDKFDLIITEAPATTLLEMLCTRSLVILFAPKDYIKFKPDALLSLKQRVDVIEEENTYLEVLSNINKPNFSLNQNVNNDSFLFSYGISKEIEDFKIELVTSINEVLAQ